MTEERVLVGLLVLTVVLSVLLILTAAATLGRKLAEVEYQHAAGVNGVRRIQSIINVRTHANRVFLGLVFLITGAMTLADTPLLWRTWIGRILLIVSLLAYTVNSVLDWLDERRQVRLLIAEQRDNHKHGEHAS